LFTILSYPIFFTSLHSPLYAAQQLGLTVNYALGTNISSTSTSGFSAALSAAASADVVIYAGGIDDSIEAEALDRNNITWPGNQLQLISELAALKKPTIVLQFGGGQIDDSSILSNSNVSALVWGGYPGQDGGTAIFDVLFGLL
jgi:xylan 1,4-beta-xylosidase